MKIKLFLIFVLVVAVVFIGVTAARAGDGTGKTEGVSVVANSEGELAQFIPDECYKQFHEVYKPRTKYSHHFIHRNPQGNYARGCGAVVKLRDNNGDVRYYANFSENQEKCWSDKLCIKNSAGFFNPGLPWKKVWATKISVLDQDEYSIVRIGGWNRRPGN